MREIVTDWGVDEAHFHNLYKNVLKSYGHGVELFKNRISIDNQLAKGIVDFYPLDNNIGLLRLNMLFTENVSFKRVLEDKPEHYACLFSLKEGVDLHAFDSFDEEELCQLGMTAKHSVLYFSADVQTLFQVVPNEQTKVVILVFTRETLREILPVSITKEDSKFFLTKSIKGYASMNASMIEKVTDVFEYKCEEDIQSLYLLGAVYQLLAVLFLQIESEGELMAQSTGVLEFARMVQIRNLLVADFSHDCPLLEEMAKKAQMSVTKFKTLFKKLFKLSYYQYYQRYRLMAARQNIILGKTVSETAYEFSFSSISNFSVAFKKMFKISPSEIETLQQ
jgi:AraC-like DNA-binding protein